MAYTSLPIEKVRELLRMKFEENLPHRAIGRQLGIGHVSVCYLSKKFIASGQIWPTQLTNDELQLLFYREKIISKPVRALPDFDEVKLKLDNGISLRKIWKSYHLQYPEGYGRSRFHELYRLWLVNRLDLSTQLQVVSNPNTSTEFKHALKNQTVNSKNSDMTENIGEALRNAEGDWYSQVHEKTVITLAGHGARLTVERDELAINPGTSASTVKDKAKTLARGVHGIKAIVIVGYAGYITLDAIEWLAQQNVALYTIDLVGDLCLNLVPAISPHRPFQRRAQYTANSFLIARSIVIEKLNEASRVKPEVTLLYRRIQNDISRMNSLEMLRLAEGRAAQLYWNQWNFELAHYKDLPEHWRKYSNRTSPLTGSGRKAVHPVNAMLNYGYTILAGRLERALVYEGYDPAAGALHAYLDGRPSLAWDLIELLRPTVDEQLIGWIQTQKWRKRDFEVNDEGKVYLRQQLARVVIQKSWIPDVKIKKVIRWYAGQLVGRKEGKVEI
ncbi:CRISPR-associated endonuclease Cas1 [Nitrosomonas ureae]|uniref:CRISPR-associated endonuclease Cas1 n=1 Tax=Nitrosomonas ureae TaxID=44577 RepID=A0A1H2HGW7_9PROT|nr:CRISPR-associated endonuclease Cas1 [Nitrosomonas ureae]SDU31046.1 CRISP-associated protein Cas1 [Nitrosomonas ureae]